MFSTISTIQFHSIGFRFSVLINSKTYYAMPYHSFVRSSCRWWWDSWKNSVKITNENDRIKKMVETQCKWQAISLHCVTPFTMSLSLPLLPPPPSLLLSSSAERHGNILFKYLNSIRHWNVCVATYYYTRPNTKPNQRWMMTELNVYDVCCGVEWPPVECGVGTKRKRETSQNCCSLSGSYGLFVLN